MKNLLNNLLNQADEIVFQSRQFCLNCGVFSSGNLLCSECSKILESDIITQQVCEKCGHPLDETGSCRFCQFFGKRDIFLRAPYVHMGLARKLVHMLKYNNVACAAEALSPKMAKAALQMAYPENTVVTWVTMPEGRLRQRGIDHGRLLAEAVAHELGLPCRQLLSRDNKKVNSTQQGQNRESRQKNLKGLFHSMSTVDSPVMLVDDVTTTGSTLVTCFDALHEAGCGTMYAVTATLAGIDYAGANSENEYAPW